MKTEDPDQGDSTAILDLLAQIKHEFETYMSDGAYDGDPVPDAVVAYQLSAKLVVPPHVTGAPSKLGDKQRDARVLNIAQHGRIGWQRKHDFGLRNLVQLAIRHHKSITGNSMRTRKMRDKNRERQYGRNLN